MLQIQDFIDTMLPLINNRANILLSTRQFNEVAEVIGSNVQQENSWVLYD